MTPVPVTAGGVLAPIRRDRKAQPSLPFGDGGAPHGLSHAGRRVGRLHVRTVMLCVPTESGQEANTRRPEVRSAFI